MFSKKIIKDCSLGDSKITVFIFIQKDLKLNYLRWICYRGKMVIGLVEDSPNSL